MKTITSSIGILALGAASLHAVYAPGLTTSEASKRWTISAGVRGFYDDNYNTAPSATSEESFGFEVNPRIGFNLPMDQTLITGSYDFSGRYFADRPDSDWDISHVFSLALDHAFSERYSAKVKNTFAVTQDPEVFDATPGTFLRSNGDNIRNNADIVFRGDFSKTLGYEVGYANNFYDFDQEGVGSYSALLDRTEHLPSASLRWFVQPQTTGILGYQFRQVNYAGDDDLALGISSKIRNSRSHTVFLGVDHDFSSQLRASARGGASYTDSYNANTDSTDPYADVSLTYSYSSSGYVQVGVKHQRTQTDVLGGNAASPVLAQQSTTAYGSVSHKFTDSLSSSLLAFYQDSSFDGGTFDGQNESYASVGISLKYDFTRHLSAEAGYSLDNLESDVASREFTRNRVFIGLRATY